METKYEYVSIVYNVKTTQFRVVAQPPGFRQEVDTRRLTGDTLNFLGELGFRLTHYNFVPEAGDIIYIMERQQPGGDSSLKTPQQEHPGFTPEEFIKATQGFVKWDEKLVAAVTGQSPAPAPDQPTDEEERLNYLEKTTGIRYKDGLPHDQPYTPVAFGGGRIHWHNNIRIQFVRAALTNTIEPKSRADFTDRYEKLLGDFRDFLEDYPQTPNYTYAEFMTVVELLNSLLDNLFTEQEIKELLF